MNLKSFEIGINGKTIGFRFNMLTIGKATRLERCSINELFERLGVVSDKEPDLITLIRFLYCAAENYYEARNEIIPISYAEFGDQMSMENLANLSNKLKTVFEAPEIKNQEAPRESGQ